MEDLRAAFVEADFVSGVADSPDAPKWLRDACHVEFGEDLVAFGVQLQVNLPSVMHSLSICGEEAGA